MNHAKTTLTAGRADDSTDSALPCLAGADGGGESMTTDEAADSVGGCV